MMISIMGEHYMLEAMQHRPRPSYIPCRTQKCHKVVASSVQQSDLGLWPATIPLQVTPLNSQDLQQGRSLND